MNAKAQANVVGIAILLGVTVLALGGLTASVGTVVDEHAASADARRVAAGFDRAIQPVRTTGVRRGSISFTSGRLHTEPRDLRVLNATGTVAQIRVNALMFDADDRGVTTLAGAILVRGDRWARVERGPPFAVGPDVLVVGAPRLNGSVHVGGSGGTTVTLETRVTHERRSLGHGSYRIAVETATPAAWERYFEQRGIAVAPRRDFDGDGVVSVIAAFPDERVAYLVVHDVAVSAR